MHESEDDMCDPRKTCTITIEREDEGNQSICNSYRVCLASRVLIVIIVEQKPNTTGTRPRPLADEQPSSFGTKDPESRRSRCSHSYY